MLVNNTRTDTDDTPVRFTVNPLHVSEASGQEHYVIIKEGDQIRADPP
jgi:hypothetical protein